MILPSKRIREIHEEILNKATDIEYSVMSEHPDFEVLLRLSKGTMSKEAVLKRNAASPKYLMAAMAFYLDEAVHHNKKQTSQNIEALIGTCDEDQFEADISAMVM